MLTTYRFLLAQLHFDSLKGNTSPKAIRATLVKLPTRSKAYNYAYNDAIERIEGQLISEEELAKRVLSWITCAKRPLITSKLEHALAIELRELQFDYENLSPIEDMVLVYARLVTIDKESGIIRLVHYTTQEYFERTQKVWFPDAETNIATICVTYFSFNDFKIGICQNDKEFKERLQSNPLYDYASHNWGHHPREASKLIPEVISFLKTKAQVEASSQALLAEKLYSSHSGYSQMFPKKMTGLHLAAYFGIKEPVIIFLEAGAVAHISDSYRRTPLSLAVENAHEVVIKLLLERGAKVDTQEISGWTPLSWAIENRNEAVVQLLLEKGAKVNIKDHSSWTPLLQAAKNGHEAIVNLLLEKGAKVDTKDHFGRTPLSQAAENGHEAIVKLLLGKGDEVDTLLWAVRNGRKAIVKLLLEKGAEVDTKDSYGDTLLGQAAKNGHEAVVRLLLEKGAKVNTLLWAEGNGLDSVVKLLLEKATAMANSELEDLCAQAMR
jgi:ankyrin repeat protein